MTVRAPSLGPRVKRRLFLCVFADVDLDAVVSSAEKLSHPTASRPRVTDRRPRSQIITSVRFVELLVTCRFQCNKINMDVRTKYNFMCVSLSVFPVHYRAGLLCSGGQEGEGPRQGGAGVCLQICRRFPEERSSYHLRTTTLTAPPRTIYFFQERTPHPRFSRF